MFIQTPSPTKSIQPIYADCTEEMKQCAIIQYSVSPACHILPQSVFAANHWFIYWRKAHWCLCKTEISYKINKISYIYYLLLWKLFRCVLVQCLPLVYSRYSKQQQESCVNKSSHFQRGSDKPHIESSIFCCWNITVNLICPGLKPRLTAAFAPTSANVSCCSQ